MVKNATRFGCIQGARTDFLLALEVSCELAVGLSCIFLWDLITWNLTDQTAEEEGVWWNHQRGGDVTSLTSLASTRHVATHLQVVKKSIQEEAFANTSEEPCRTTILHAHRSLGFLPRT